MEIYEGTLALHMLINKEYFAIPKEYDKLIISLMTPYANEILT